MKIAIIICLTIILVALLAITPILQQQYYEHLEKVKKNDYELAIKQIELEKEKVRYSK